MAIKRGLGKGLDSLIPNKPEKEEVKDENKVKSEMIVDINEVEPNKEQPRRNFEEDSMQELAESIKQYGILQPLLVQKKDNYYEIIAGERRWRAAKIAGVKQIPIIVKDYSPREIVEISLIENIQREDLNPIEEAIAFQGLISEYNLKQDEVAERVSKSRVYITNTVRLLKLDKRVQEMLIDDMITSGHARALIPIQDGDKQYTVATRIFDEKLSVRETERLIKSLLEEKPAKTVDNKKAEDLIYKEIEEKIKSILGTKVLIQNKGNNKGKIQIEYYSNEELERIIEILESARMGD